MLEHEMIKLYQKAEIEGELDDDEDYEEHSGWMIVPCLNERENQNQNRKRD